MASKELVVNDNNKTQAVTTSTEAKDAGAHDAYNERVLCCWACACEVFCIKRFCLSLGDLDFVTHGYLKRLRIIQNKKDQTEEDVKAEIAGLVDSMKTFWELIGVIAALIGSIAIDVSLNGVEYGSGELFDEETIDRLYIINDDIEEWLYTIYAVSAIAGSYFNLLCVFFCALYHAILTAVIDDFKDIEDFLRYFPVWVPLFLIAQGLVWFIISLGFTWLLVHPWRVVIVVTFLLLVSLVAVLWLGAFWTRMSREIIMRSKLTPEEVGNKLIVCPCRGSMKNIG